MIKKELLTGLIMEDVKSYRLYNERGWIRGEYYPSINAVTVAIHVEKINRILFLRNIKHESFNGDIHKAFLPPEYTIDMFMKDTGLVYGKQYD